MDEDVATFVSLTGATTEEALMYLEMVSGDDAMVNDSLVESAANLYWDTHQTGARTANVNTFTDDVRAPIQARVDNVSL